MRQLTPSGLAGIAVLVAAPEQRRAVAAALRTPGGQPFQLRPGAPPRRARLVLDGQVIDDLLVVDRDSAGLELHLHGAPAVLDAVRGAFGSEPEPALAPAERLLREALSVEAFALAVEQSAFDFERELERLRELPPAERAAACAAAVARSEVARALAAPATVALVGRQNAGKSSLFNCLSGHERALVGAVPGLTRDPVSEVVVLRGYPWRLVDTAGEGPAPASADAAAIGRSRQVRRDAIVVLVVDAAVGPDARDLELAAEAALVVASKCDQPRAPWPAAVPRHLEVSAIATDPALIRAAFGAMLQRWRRLPEPGPVGGFAALTDQQWSDLLQLARAGAAGGGDPPSA